MKLWIAIAALALGCAEEPAEPGAPISVVRGVVTISPSELTVGDVAEVDVSVVTPPDTLVQDFSWPDVVPGVSISDATPLVTRREANRWVHRARARARALEIGAYQWPEVRLVIRPADGERGELVLAGEAFAVVSTLSASPDQLTAYGLRGPVGGSSVRDLVLAAAAGAGGTLALVVGVLALRRRSHAESPPPPDVPDTEPWRAAERTISHAAELANGNAREFADQVGHALREYAVRRFGVSIESSTTEELARRRPPRNMRSRWGPFVELLAELDALRFAPERGTHRREALDQTTERALDFIRETTPERS